MLRELKIRNLLEEAEVCELREEEEENCAALYGDDDDYEPPDIWNDMRF